VQHGHELGFLLIVFFLSLVKSKSFAYEVRAIVPLPKGTEVLYTYQPDLLNRAERQEVILKNFGFVCNCELCALPDDLSGALDVKINLANYATEEFDCFFESEPDEQESIRALRLLDNYMSIVIQERLFFDYPKLYLPIPLFAVFGNATLLRQVGQAIIRVLRRHLGTGVCGGNAGVEFAAPYFEMALRHADSSLHALLAADRAHPLNAQLRKTAASIISNLESLP
jgi:hypothetical protein